MDRRGVRAVVGIRSDPGDGLCVSYRFWLRSLSGAPLFGYWLFDGDAMLDYRLALLDQGATTPFGGGLTPAPLRMNDRDRRGA